MCLTLPETLISVVGIEKLIPTFRDLEVFLQLLPRSVDRRADEPLQLDLDGRHPERRTADVHIVLLDNGRTRALADDIGRQALRCIRCAACLNVCPVYERTGGHAYGATYPGPIGAILTPLMVGVEHAPAAAVRIESVRRLLRGVPGRDRHPDRARQAPPRRREGRTPQGCRMRRSPRRPRR